MNLSSFGRFRGVAAETGLLFFFDGELSAAAVAGLAETVRARLESAAVPVSARRRLHSTVVELAQNVVHYAAGAGTDGKPGVLALGAGGSEYWVVCSNRLASEVAPRLAARLDAIRAMTPEQVRAAYRAKLDDEDHERDDAISRGAGLGLLTIARHATAPLEYALEPDPEEPAIHRLFLCARLDTQAASRSSP